MRTQKKKTKSAQSNKRKHPPRPSTPAPKSAPAHSQERWKEDVDFYDLDETDFSPDQPLPDDEPEDRPRQSFH